MSLQKKKTGLVLEGGAIRSTVRKLKRRYLWKENNRLLRYSG